MEDKLYKFCQSCGMPLKKSPNGGGTNADLTISNKYCNYCYGNGVFNQPDWTAAQMRDFVKKEMIEKGFPSFLARFFSMGIPKLERWQKKGK